ncbi:non-ribosomal peptide synthetase [Streptomyces jeddahensis]|uniref:Surfactin synthase subunit 1 n=1 Tax=Streptomyces jeddahensis TaxID=1716141 RepID=A0A177HFW4_9ACTN|nr:non-ribosomal peptide synthetase [Streptomyces jeddahensis]OAH09470.1 surfactin synthase subunit 1 [Streptomyces jeddahensis]
MTSADRLAFEEGKPSVGAELLEIAVKASTADRNGVTHRGETVPYPMLMDMATEVAKSLRAQHVARASVVGISAPPGPALVTAILAAISAGMCYVYIDPEWPESHRRRTLELSGAVAVLEQSRHMWWQPDPIAVRLLADPARRAGGAAHAQAAGAACLISTSGTTGTPRLVGMTPHAITHLVRDSDLIRLRRDDRLLMLAHPGFGAFLWELWAALDGSADLVIPDERKMSLSGLADMVERSGATVVHLTAGLFRQFIPRHVSALSGTRLVMCGGDTVPPEQFGIARAALGGELVACYGCTENTVFTTLYRADGEIDPMSPIPLGEPLRGTEVHVLTDDLRPVGPGETGELYVSGEGLAAGYINDAAATAERFIMLPASTGSAGVRAYRTGDFARCREDGSYVLVGRQDRQVQIRGFRVELSEVEHLCRSLDTVDDAHAIYLRDEADDELVVLLTVTAGITADAADILREVRKHLPDFMVPGRAVIVDALPLTDRGKIDRNRAAELARPPRLTGPATADSPPDATGGSATAGFEADQQVVLERVSAIWADVLKLTAVDPDVHFTDLGGHSLRATQVLSRVADVFGISVPLRQFYEDATVRGLATQIEAELRK